MRRERNPFGIAHVGVSEQQPAPDFKCGFRILNFADGIKAVKILRHGFKVANIIFQFALFARKIQRIHKQRHRRVKRHNGQFFGESIGNPHLYERKHKRAEQPRFRRNAPRNQPCHGSFQFFQRQQHRQNKKYQIDGGIHRSVAVEQRKIAKQPHGQRCEHRRRRQNGEHNQPHGTAALFGQKNIIYRAAVLRPVEFPQHRNRCRFFFRSSSGLCRGAVKFLVRRAVRCRKRCIVRRIRFRCGFGKIRLHTGFLCICIYIRCVGIFRFARFFFRDIFGFQPRKQTEFFCLFAAAFQ